MQLRAERSDIAGDIACAPDLNGVVLDLKNRRRRFGRNARNIPIDEIVEHDVADAKNGLIADSRRASSKSNMLLPRPPSDPSPISIGAIEIATHVFLDPVFQSGEIGIEAGAAQIFGLGLREILIGVADRLRHLDVFDVWLPAERRQHRQHQIAETARLAGADVEDTRYRGRLKQPAHHGDGIIHVNEVALLLAIGDAGAIRLEQPHRLAGLRLIETLRHETHHLAFVVFVGAEHIEEFKPGPLRRQFVLARNAFNDGEVEQMLGPAVGGSTA